LADPFHGKGRTGRVTVSGPALKRHPASGFPQALACAGFRHLDAAVCRQKHPCGFTGGPGAGRRRDSVDLDLTQYMQTAPLLALAVAFAGGVATGFTPCVYPILPITVSFIGARGVRSRFHAFSLSMLYALGIAVTYASLGIFAALTGRIFGDLTQNPFVYLTVGNVIMLFGLNMMDVFHLPLPGFLGRMGAGKGKTGLLGAFVMGLTSGLVVGPCTAPVLAAILTYVGTRGEVILGGATLFVFALGMSLLVVVAGTFSGALSLLPKSGEWMVKVKKGFGWVMIVLGEFFLVRAGIYW
jgi:cytochrome c-type biogenesis protein